MAKFSKGHYNVLAEALNSAYRYVEYENAAVSSGVKIAAAMLADRLEADNPAFSREHFLAVIRGDKPVNSRPTPLVCRYKDTREKWHCVRYHGHRGEHSPFVVDEQNS